MSKNNKSDFTDKEFVEIINKCQTMAQAAKMLGMAYFSFIRKVKAFNCYKPNQSGKGMKKHAKNPTRRYICWNVSKLSNI